MTYEQLFKAVDESGLSIDAVAARLGISHMTLRRWRGRRGAVSAMYERSFSPVLAELVKEGRLPAASIPAPGPVKAGGNFRETLKRLGFPDDILSGKGGDNKNLIEGLSKVGAGTEQKRQVDRSIRSLGRFMAPGGEWKERISLMVNVIRSADLLTSDKLVAYGALFYLITPMDLIPDTIPVIGLLDDFAILGLAAWFYRDRFPFLFKRR